MINHNMVFAIVFITLVILALLTGMVLTMLIASRQRMALTQTRLDYAHELRSIENEVREATLNYLSAELHDNIGQQLTFMKLQIEKELLKQPAIAPALAPIADTLRQSLQQVRLLSHSLNHDFISDRGLQQLISAEVQRLRQLGSPLVHFTTDDVEPVLEKDQRLVAFRIFQELQSNALRHAGAAHLFIELRGCDNFCLIVRDDGQGFDTSAVLAAPAGIGLKNMLKRAALAGLQCTITSAPTQGSRCCLTIVPTSAV